MRFPGIAAHPLPGTLMILSLAVAGCGGGGGGGSASSPATRSTAQTTKSAAAGAKQVLALSADKEGELYFEPKKLTVKQLKTNAGNVTLTMDNPSDVPHAIAVEGNGVDKDGQTVTKGGKSTVTADLKPGKYEFYCPFDSHKKMGMKGTLTVT